MGSFSSFITSFNVSENIRNKTLPKIFFHSFLGFSEWCRSALKIICVLHVKENLSRAREN